MKSRCEFRLQMFSTCTACPRRDARAVVDEYLEEAQRLGLNALRIIMGGVSGRQREMVRRVLESKDYVAAFRDAPAEGRMGRHGGDPAMKNEMRAGWR